MSVTAVTVIRQRLLPGLYIPIQTVTCSIRLLIQFTMHVSAILVSVFVVTLAIQLAEGNRCAGVACSPPRYCGNGVPLVQKPGSCCPTCP